MDFYLKFDDKNLATLPAYLTRGVATSWIMVHFFS